MTIRSYFDIETTGLSPAYGELTVVGAGFETGDRWEFVQWTSEHILAERVAEQIRRADIVYTYNGTRFDLPFVKAKLGVDLRELAVHKDLMYECWRRNLYGGLKAVETKLGIARRTEGVDGRMAVRLWFDYVNNGNQSSLALLLDYNKEDVSNLSILRRKLGV